MYREIELCSAPKAPHKDADPLPPPSFEQVVYWITRTVVALTGLGALAVPVMIAEADRDSFALHIFGLALGLALAALMLCPNRLTVDGWPFVCRLVASILVGLLFIGIGLSGANDLAISLICGLGLPGCLWWQSIKTVRKSNQSDQELS